MQAATRSGDFAMSSDEFLFRQWSTELNAIQETGTAP